MISFTYSKFREDTDELHNYLNELKRVLVEEDQERLSKEQLDRRRFLNKFPRVKRQLEEFIGKFHELADKVEKVHKGCTISNVMAHSTGAVSSILTIVGLALTPVTMGASLALLATGIGLGSAAGVTSVSTSIIERVKRSSAETEASRMMSTVVKKWEVLLEVLNNNPHIDATKKKEAIQCIEMHTHAMETGNANPGSAANASIYMSPGRISVPAIQHIETGFKATAFIVTKGARIAGLARPRGMIFRQWLLDDDGGDDVGGSSGVTTQWMEHLTRCQELFGSRVHRETSDVSMKIQMWRRNRG
nr:PREDICTED: apolipoprotein L3-like [Bos mutus]